MKRIVRHLVRKHRIVCVLTDNDTMYIIFLGLKYIRCQFISLFSVEYSTSDTDDSTEREKDQLTTRISNNQGICSEFNESKEDRQPFKTSII